MTKKQSIRLNQITWKPWLMFLLLSQAVYAVMMVYTIPRIRQGAGDMVPFDMRPMGYSGEYARQFLSRLSEKGRDLYLHVQLPLDLAYPLFFGLAGFFTVVLLIRLFARVVNRPKLSVDSVAARVMMLVPLIALVSDYLENILIFSMLAWKTPVPEALVFVANLFTLGKSLSTMAFYGIVTVLLLGVGIGWVVRKMKGEAADGTIRKTGEKSRHVESVHHGGNVAASEVKTAP